MTMVWTVRRSTSSVVHSSCGVTRSCSSSCAPVIMSTGALCSSSLCTAVDGSAERKSSTDGTSPLATRGAADESVCIASCFDGTMINACRGSTRRRRASSGSKYAYVLPEPV
eukprot:2185724-Pleurochrysis_carterae.AAC.4